MRIGIAVDGSSYSYAAVELISALPLSGSDHVWVISVAQAPVPLGAAFLAHVPSVAGYLDLVAKSAEQRARLVVEHAAERLIGLPCPVTTVVLTGHPVESLIRIVTDVELDLLVLGPRGLGGVGSALQGSVSQAMLHTMPTSILIARPPTREPDRVILAVDGSSPSLAATDFLSHFPLPVGVDVRVVVSVTSWIEEYRHIEAPDFRLLAAAEREHAQGIAERAAVVLREQSGRQCTTIIRDGDPKREILQAALELDADLIVTGARGLGGFTGLLLGSVSLAVSKAAPCSVLVVAVTPPAGIEPAMEAPT